MAEPENEICDIAETLDPVTLQASTNPPGGLKDGYTISPYWRSLGENDASVFSARQLSLAGFPPTTTAGAPASLLLTFKDQFGNIATGYTGTVQFSSSDVQAGLPQNYTFTTADACVHSFTATLLTAGTESLTATDTSNSSLTVTQSAIIVNPAAASIFVITGFPTTITAGQSGNFTVTAKDAYNNTVSGYTGTVMFSSSHPLATLPGHTTLTNGSGTFSAAFHTGGTQSLTATDTSNSSLTGTLSDITVNSPTVTVNSPTVTISGTVFQDININGVQDSGEPGIAGQTMFLDLSGSGVLAMGDPTTTTDENGNYQFTVSSPGTYTVRPVLMGGVLLDTPVGGSLQVTVSESNVTGQNFAEVPTSITVPLTLPLSTPFPKQGNANADFVEALYRAILNRNADPSGLAAWTGLLNSGTMTLLQVVQGIRQSQEHFQQEVTDFYMTILGRAARSYGPSKLGERIGKRPDDRRAGSVRLPRLAGVPRQGGQVLYRPHVSVAAGSHVRRRWRGAMAKRLGGRREWQSNAPGEHDP